MDTGKFANGKGGCYNKAAFHGSARIQTAAAAEQNRAECRRKTMRLRNVTGSRDFIAASTDVVQDYLKHAGSWDSVFGGPGRLRIEIGTGKGQFITRLAQMNPEIHYIGIEKYSTVLLRAIQKKEKIRAESENPDILSNLLYLRMDAEEIANVFAPGEVDEIYLNFSDPWPKDRHANRRLTSVPFLIRYQRILKPKGKIYFKTDNVPLFDFSLEQIRKAGWNLLYVTRDLHGSSYNEGNVTTEYEDRFSAQGNAIMALAAERPDDRPSGLEK